MTLNLVLIQPFLLHEEVHYFPQTTMTKCGISPRGEDGVPVADVTTFPTQREGEELGETTRPFPQSRTIDIKVE